MRNLAILKIIGVGVSQNQSRKEERTGLSLVPLPTPPKGGLRRNPSDPKDWGAE